MWGHFILSKCAFAHAIVSAGHVLKCFAIDLVFINFAHFFTLSLFRTDLICVFRLFFATYIDIRFYMKYPLGF